LNMSNGSIASTGDIRFILTCYRAFVCWQAIALVYTILDSNHAVKNPHLGGCAAIPKRSDNHPKRFPISKLFPTHFIIPSNFYCTALGRVMEKLAR
ncbi:MAG: hypothetical protein O7C75_01790, partial [Verrucomicrobia bacterium]|nr:hypothetical protein [Verrucomicrobiota bacterium]